MRTNNMLNKSNNKSLYCIFLFIVLFLSMFNLDKKSALKYSMLVFKIFQTKRAK